jgi:hypothetical protein
VLELVYDSVTPVNLIVDANAVWYKHYDDISLCESGTTTLIARGKSVC